MAETAATEWGRERYGFSSTSAGDRANQTAERIAEGAAQVDFASLGQQLRGLDDADLGRLACALLTRYWWQVGSPPEWMTRDRLEAALSKMESDRPMAIVAE